MDRFYDYAGFSDEKLHHVLTEWDGLSGNHGDMIKVVAKLIPEGKSVLDVGCGLCHLYEAVRRLHKVGLYVGVDKDPRVVKWAKARYPAFDIRRGDVYDLSELPKLDIVTAIGLYSDEPENPKGIRELLAHAKEKLIITYWHKHRYRYPHFLRQFVVSAAFPIEHQTWPWKMTILEVFI